MPKATRRWISEKVKSLRESEVLPFHDLLDADLVKSAPDAEGVAFKKRTSTPLVTLCLSLSQVLGPGHSCRAAVARLVVWLAINGRKPCAPETNSDRDARQRPPLGVVVRPVRQTAQESDAGASDEGPWKGRRVAMVDGATASMPDIGKDQRVFPQSNTQDAGLGFPPVRMVAIISRATGVVRDLAPGPYEGKETGETALVRTLLEGLAAGEIVPGDRCLASYFMPAELMQRGVDGLFRMHPRRKFDFRRGRRPGWEDHAVTWTKPQRPEWMDEETSAQTANELTIRELRFKVAQPGFRVNGLVLVTTMLDAAEYSKGAPANLDLQRRDLELDPRAIKDVLERDVLRCKSPEMVEKGIRVHLSAYNLLRCVMAKVAEAHDKGPRQLGFKGALQTMTASQDVLRGASPGARRYLVEVMLEALSNHDVGDRPGRVEPRADKRRPQSQRFLMEPRKQARKRLMQAA